MPTIIPRPRKGERVDRPSTFQLVWYLPLKPGEDKRQRVTETFHGTKTAAEIRWRERQAEIDGQGKAYTPPSKQVLAEYLDEWLRDHVRVNLRATTVANYEHQVRYHIVPALGHLKLSEITTQALKAWVGGLATPKADGGSGLSPRSTAIARTVLREALEEAVRVGQIPNNPLDRVRPPRQQPKRVDSFTVQQIRALSRVTEQHRLANLFTVLWQTGLRIGEALALRWEDLDLDNASLTVHRNLVEVHGHMLLQRPKTIAGEREIALTAQTVAVFRRQQEAQAVERMIHGEGWNPDGLVFPSEAGTPLMRRNVSRAWAILRDRAGLPRYGLHALRHTAASLQLMAGIGLREISATLGHESPAFTARIYAHVLEQTKRQATERLERLLDADFEADA